MNETKIIKMMFSNEAFEKGVAVSKESLKSLDEALKLKNAKKGFNDIDEGAKNVDLNGVQKGIDAIKEKFSAMGIIGITVLQNLTTAAMGFASKAAKALTVTPIVDGFKEYETKMEATKVILTNTASAGTKLKDVNKALGELNTYSDKTIYNFADMTKNIGLFTAAGVGLKTSTSSIKGIANLAAGTGASAAQASNVMYQLSQALSTGTVKLMDWKSVENSNMGGKIFQDQLLKTADSMGVVVDTSDSFRASLESGWLSADILTTTLSRMAEDPSLIKAATQVTTFTQLLSTMAETLGSGWAKTWEEIIGGKEESAKLLTSISDGFSAIIGPASEARNAALAFWSKKATGGRDAFIAGLANIFKGFMKIASSIADAFHEVFPPATGAQLVTASKNFEELTSKLIVSDWAAKAIKMTFKGLFSIIKIGVTIFKTLLKVAVSVALGLRPLGLIFITITGAIGSLISGIASLLTMFTTLEVGASKSTNKLSSKTLANMFSIQDASGSLKKTLDTLASMLNAVNKALSSVFKAIKETFATADITDFAAVLSAMFIGGGMKSFSRFFDNLSEISYNAGSILNGVTGILDGVRNSLAMYQKSLKADVLMKLAAAIGLLSLSILVLSAIDAAALAKALVGMGVLFAELFLMLTVFLNLNAKAGIFGLLKISTTMLALTVAIMGLTISLKILASIKLGSLVKAIVALGVISYMLLVMTESFGRANTKSLAGIGKLIVLGLALQVFAAVLQQLAKIPFTSLVKSLAGLFIVLKLMSSFMKADISGMSVKTALSLMIFATALTVLTEAVKTLAGIKASSLLKSLGAVGLLLGTLAIFTKTVGSAPGLIKTSAGLYILGYALQEIAKAMTILGELSWQGITKGLVVIAAGLSVIKNQMAKFKGPGLLLAAANLYFISKALTQLAKVLDTMGGLTWTEIGKGLTTLAASLLVLTVAMKFMGKEMAGAIVLTATAIALRILTPALVSLSKIPLKGTVAMMAALAGVFAVLGVAALILKPLIPVMLALSVAIAIFGVGVLALGAGIGALAAGMAALVVVFTSGLGALVMGLTTLMNLIPKFITKIAEGIVGAITVIGDHAKDIANAIHLIVLAVVNQFVVDTPLLVTAFLEMIIKLGAALVEAAPTLIQQGITLLVAFLTGIRDNIFQVTQIAIDIVINFIEGIASRIGDIIQAGFDLMLAFINGLATAIEENAKPFQEAFTNLINAALYAALIFIIGDIPEFIKSGKELVLGILEGWKAKVGKFFEAAGALPGKALAAIGSHLSEWWTSGKNMIEKLKKGLNDKKQAFFDAAGALPGKALQAVKDKITGWWEAGKSMVSGLIKGIKSTIQDVRDAGSAIGKAALKAAKAAIDSNSPSKEFAKLGVYSGEGYVVGIKNSLGKVITSTYGMGKTAISSLKKGLSTANLMADINTDPVIRPVLDLSLVKDSAKELATLLDSGKTGINVSGMANVTGNISDSIEKKKQSISSPITLTQNNYSPESLSRIEIYRQTQNQFATLKDLVTN